MIIVVGLAFEARIAAGPGVRVICSGDGRNLAAKLTAAIADARKRVQGCPGIISFGVAGGLAPQLRPGTCVVGSAVISGEKRMPISAEWSQKLLQTIPDAIPGVLLGVPVPIAHPDEKRELYMKTGAIAVDMESHIVAAVGFAHRAAGRGDPRHHRSRQARVAGLRGCGDAAERHHQYRRHAPLGAAAAEGIAGSLSNGARRACRTGNAGAWKAFTRSRIHLAIDDLRGIRHVQVRCGRDRRVG